MIIERIGLRLNDIDFTAIVGRKTSNTVSLECHSEKQYKLLEQTYSCQEPLIDSFHKSFREITEEYSNSVTIEFINKFAYCLTTLIQDLNIKDSIGSELFRRRVVKSLLRKFNLVDDSISSTFIIGHSPEGVCVTKYNPDSQVQESFCFNEFFLDLEIVLDEVNNFIAYEKLLSRFLEVVDLALQEALTIKFTLEDFIEVFSQYYCSAIAVLGNTPEVISFRRRISYERLIFDESHLNDSSLKDLSLKEVAERILKSKEGYFEDYHDLLKEEALSRKEVNKSYRSIINNQYRFKFNKQKNQTRYACHKAHLSRKIIRNRYR